MLYANQTNNGTCTILTPEQIVANIDFVQLEAFLVNAGFQITGVIEGEINGASFTIDVNTTEAVGSDFVTALEQFLADQIAKFLGGGYTAGDITVDVSPSTPTTTKRQANDPATHTASITISGYANSTPALAFNICLAVALVLFFAL